MITNRKSAPHVLVRREFSDEAVYREALGPTVPLLMLASTEGCLDAPEFLPTGGAASHIAACYAGRSLS